MKDQPIFEDNLLKEGSNLISSSASTLVILPPDPSTDLLASGLSLFLTLKNAGKQAQIGSSNPLRVDNSHLFGIDQVKTSVGNQNLLISLDFKEDQLNKVDYDFDENGKFILMIQPKAGISAPDSSSVSFNYSGANADLVFVLGINSLEELGEIYASEKTFLDNAKIISINNSIKPGGTGSVQFHTNKCLCLSELVANLIKNWGLTPSEDAASNLLSQISATSNNFSSPKVTADTFELIAFLIRSGGQLASSPLSSSSRFGAFPPPPFGVPTFDEDYEPTPFPRIKRTPMIMPPRINDKG